MLSAALIVLAIAAAGGAILASHVLRDRFAPWALSLLHAALGATALILLGLVAVQSTDRLILAGLGLLVVAALGGFFLASFHLRHKLAPKPVVVLHALLAVGGFGVILAAALA